MTAKNNMEDTSPSKDTSKDLDPTTQKLLKELKELNDQNYRITSNTDATETLKAVFDGENPPEIVKTSAQDPVIEKTGNVNARDQLNQIAEEKEKTAKQKESAEAIKHTQVLTQILSKDYPHGMNYKDIVKCLEDNFLYGDISIPGARPGHTLTQKEKAALEYAKEHYGDIAQSSKEGDTGVLEIKDISPYVTQKAYDASR